MSVQLPAAAATGGARRRRVSVGSGAVAAVACAGALALAAHHPLGAAAALGVVLAAMALSWRWPAPALTALLAVLPVCGLAPWTGWLVAEEFDGLLLAVAAGVFARAAWAPAPAARGAGTAWSLPGIVLLALVGLTVAVGLVRGVQDAGGWLFGWTQGLREPANALRLGKVFFAALLGGALWATVRRLAPGDPRAAVATGAAALSPTTLAVLRGMALGLAATALATVWERAAFTGVLNFSADYRTTALFWEMHVGGAALDGYLALAMPFALLLALSAVRTADQVVAAAALLLGAYAALTTFSRIVYLAVPAALVVLGALLVAQRVRRQRALGAWALWRTEIGPGLGVAAAFAAAAFAVFLHGGYRAVLGLLGCTALLLPLAGAAARLSAGEWAGSAALGAVAAMLALGAGLLLPKGPYLMHGLAVAAGAAALAWHWRAAPAAGMGRPAGLALPLAVAAFVAAVATTGHVAWHWGGQRALWEAAPVLLALPVLLLVAARRRGGLWPARLRWQALVFGALLALSGLVGVLAGGAYFSGRVGSTQADIGVREAHWRKSLSLVHDDAQQWFGLGLGRYLDHYALASNERDRPGDYRHAVDAAGNGHLVLIGGTHVQGWGEMLRVSQRITRPGGGLVLTLKVRSTRPVRLHADVCLKHLLYTNDCRSAEFAVPATAGQWHPVRVAFKPEPLRDDDDWYAPRFTALSLASSSAAAPVDIDEVALVDASGRDHLHNGGFEAGLERWFVTSDANHLPWHAKSLPVHLLVEQGFTGLAAMGLLLVGALWRLVAGRARDHALAPALAAAMVGFLVVGLIDSLFDMPRVAWVFLWLVVISFGLRGPAATGATRG